MEVLDREWQRGENAAKCKASLGLHFVSQTSKRQKDKKLYKM
jgi:hypothetical protein